MGSSVQIRMRPQTHPLLHKVAQLRPKMPHGSHGSFAHPTNHEHGSPRRRVAPSPAPTSTPFVDVGERRSPIAAICVHAFVRMAKGSVFITIERCKGCGFCVEFCPTHVLSLSSAFNSKGYHPPHVVATEKCSGCDLCGLYCPDFAIYGARHAS